MGPDVEGILSFIDKSKGLRIKISDVSRLSIIQETDDKIFTFDSHDIIEVLHRKDAENNPFVQLNFQSSHKVLLTDNLIGFKPQETLGLDMNRIPKVVTTPDLFSVYEAIEESLGSDTQDHEVEILKKVFLAILNGGERIGFDLSFERKWLGRLLASRTKASA